MAEAQVAADTFDRLDRAFHRVAPTAGTIDTDFLVDGLRLRFRFAGSALVPWLTPALRHLEARAGGAVPDLTVQLWDSVSTATPFPGIPPAPEQLGLRGELKGCADGRYLAAAQVEVRSFSLLDCERNLGMYWVQDPTRLRIYERAAPLKELLHWWFRTQGRPMIHAGAIGSPAQGGVLLVGGTGAGKSTTALTCLEQGFDYVTDDRCLVTEGPEPCAICLYDSAKLHFDQARRFPAFIPAAASGEEKALFHLRELAPGQLASRLPLRVVLMCRLAGTEETKLAPVARSEILKVLASSSLMYLPGAAQAEVRAMGELLRRLPCFRLDLGTRLEAIPPVIRCALSQAAG